jgi:hypothetical protein
VPSFYSKGYLHMRLTNQSQLATCQLSDSVRLSALPTRGMVIDLANDHREINGQSAANHISFFYSYSENRANKNIFR